MHSRAHIEPFRFHRAEYVMRLNPLNAELNPICHLLALLGGSTIVVVSRLRVNGHIVTYITVALCLSCGKRMVVCKM